MWWKEFGRITDCSLSADNVAGLADAGRARWKIQNAHHNAIEKRGHHLEHNFGHGKQPLASLLLRMNLLALGLHTVLEWADENERRIRATVGARRRCFEHLEALTAYLDLESWERRMDFSMRSLETGPSAAPESCDRPPGRRDASRS